MGGHPVFTLLMVALGALFLAGFVKYTVFVHQAWAEGEAERIGLDSEGKGIGTILRGRYRGVPLWLAMSGRRVTEGEAKLPHGVTAPSRADFLAAQELFGSAHYKPGAVWADFPRSKPGEPPERYADALVVVATFAATHSLEQLSRIEAGEEE